MRQEVKQNSLVVFESLREDQSGTENQREKEEEEDLHCKKTSFGLYLVTENFSLAEESVQIKKC